MPSFWRAMTLTSSVSLSTYPFSNMRVMFYATLVAIAEVVPISLCRQCANYEVIYDDLRAIF